MTTQDRDRMPECYYGPIDAKDDVWPADSHEEDFDDYDDREAIETDREYDRVEELYLGIGDFERQH